MTVTTSTNLQTFGTEAIEPWMLPIKKAWVTNIIIVINALVFIAMAIDSGGSSIITPSSELLVKWQLDWGPLTLDGEPWRLLTSTFVHIGILHILCNMVVLSRVGTTCEMLYGRMKYAVLYLLTGIAASVCSLMVHADSGSAGASGAICGLIGAYSAFILMHKKDIEPKVFVESMKQIGVYLAYCVIYGLMIRADQAAHLGGLLAGLALGAAMAPNNNSERKFRALDFLGIIGLSISMAGLFRLEQSGTFDKSGTLTFSKASNAFRRDKDLNKAIALIESPPAETIDTAFANQMRASLYLEANQIKKAKPAIAKLLKEQPDDPTALQLAMEIAFMDRDYPQVLLHTTKMLNLPDEQSERKAYFAFAHYLACRRLGVKEADEQLKEIKASLPETSWPYKVASYLDGSLSEKEFMDAATNNDEKTETNTYVGMMKLFAGKPKEAKALFEWVVKNGNREFIEYHYAVQELKDMRDNKSRK